MFEVLHVLVFQFIGQRYHLFWKLLRPLTGILHRHLASVLNPPDRLLQLLFLRPGIFLLDIALAFHNIDMFFLAENLPLKLLNLLF